MPFLLFGYPKVKRVEIPKPKKGKVVLGKSYIQYGSKTFKYYIYTNLSDVNFTNTIPLYLWINCYSQLGIKIQLKLMTAQHNVSSLPIGQYDQLKNIKKYIT